MSPEPTKRMRDIMVKIKEASYTAVESGKKPTWCVRRVRKEFVYPLIAMFEKRVGFKVTVHEVNTYVWLTCKGRHEKFLRTVWDACETFGNDSLHKTDYHRNEIRIAKRFPELARLAWLAFEIDSLPGRPSLTGSTKPL